MLTVRGIFRRRADVRAQATVLCACLSFVYFFNLSSPGMLDRSRQLKGTDFIHFYVPGSVALQGPAHALYDAEALARRPSALVPESTSVYPPHANRRSFAPHHSTGFNGAHGPGKHAAPCTGGGAVNARGDRDKTTDTGPE